MRVATVVLTIIAAAGCGGRTSVPPAPTTPALSAQQPMARSAAAQDDHHLFVLPDRIEWRAGPPSLPPGARAAIIHGDPSRQGLFAMRLSFPDGYRIPPHFHASDEHVTVISGTFVMGLGEREDDENATAIPAGGFARMKAGTRHYAYARGATVVQVHSLGPWVLTYVNPADDPRRATP